MRTGLFCTYENPTGDYRAAYAAQLKLVQLIERLGFDEAWVAEHHFNPSAASPSSLSIVAHLAACTTRLRLGSAAVPLPFRNPLLVAEDVATADILSDGRFNFGVAKGGPFPLQNKHFGADPQNSRAKMTEALRLVGRLLEEDHVSFGGEFFTADDVSLTPKPLQRPVPIFIATSTADTVKLAADHGYGVMAGPPFPLDEVRKNLRLYREIAPQGEPKLVLIRFYHLAPTYAQAMEEAAVLLRPFLERMQTATAALQPAWTPWFDMDRLIADSLIGTAAEVGEKARWLQAELRPQSLILKPIVSDQAKQCADLETFAGQIAHRLALADA
jgi:alkanesulfonate monooxygenase SsuD/methylene tetrahydromethanopterin reductase-like flavin-dependent oxidoreductase (luciferase family)